MSMAVFQQNFSGGQIRPAGYPMPTPVLKDDCWPSMMLPDDDAESTWCNTTITFKNHDDETNGHGPLLLTVVYPTCRGHRNNLLSAFYSIVVGDPWGQKQTHLDKPQLLPQQNKRIKKEPFRGQSQDGGGTGGETTFSPTNSSKNHLNAEQLPQNNFQMLAEDIRHPERQPILFEKR